jgi:hypothetical protein
MTYDPGSKRACTGQVRARPRVTMMAEKRGRLTAARWPLINRGLFRLRPAPTERDLNDALRTQAVQCSSQGVSDRLVRPLHDVCVDAHGHGRIGVPKPTSNGANIVTCADRRGSGPVPQIMQPPLHVDARRLAGPSPPPADAVGIGGTLVQ